MSKVFEQYSDGSFKETNAKNVIDVYKVSGEYIGTYTSNSKEEFEGITYKESENRFAIVANGSPDKVYYGISIPLP